MRRVKIDRSVLLTIASLALFLPGGSIGLAQQHGQAPALELRLAETEPGEGLEKLEVEDGSPLYLHAESILRVEDIEKVESKKDGSGTGVSIQLTARGGEKIGEASGAHVGKPMAILYNGSLVAAPLIQSKLGRQVQVSGNFTEEQIKEIVEALEPGPRVASFDAEELEKFSARLDRAFANRIFSGTVLIAVEGQIVFEKSVGYANIADKTPFTKNSSFRLASLSKQFTAMGIMLLKEDGKLDFDDDITKHLPTLPYKGVTIRHLLHHNGGLPDYASWFYKNWDSDAKPGEKKTAFNKDVIEQFSEHKPGVGFEPGERHQYSNTGYVVLGSIIEAVSNQSIHDFFATRVFKPLDMEDSYAFSPDVDVFNPSARVYGFSFKGKDDHDANDWNYLNGMVGDGGIYCSARDLLKWDQALYGDQLVSQATLDEAFVSGKLNDGEETGYGFGWVVQSSKDQGLTVSHGGQWVGFRTFIKRQPDRKLTVIVLTNNSASKFDQVLDAIDELCQ